MEMTNDREEALKQAYEGLKDKVDFNTFYSFFSSWEIIPIKSNSEIIGAIFFKGKEGHVSVNPTKHKRWNPRKYMREVVLPRLLEYGELETSVLKQNKFACEWTEKLGFEKTKEDEFRVFYKMTRANYV